MIMGASTNHQTKVEQATQFKQTILKIGSSDFWELRVGR